MTHLLLMAMMAIPLDGHSGDIDAPGGGTFAGGTITVDTSLEDDVNLCFGDSDDVCMQWDTGQTVDTMILGLDNTTRTLIVTEKQDMATDFSLLARDEPTILIMGVDAESDPTQRMAIRYNSLGGSISVASGDLVLTGNGANTITLDNVSADFGVRIRSANGSVGLPGMSFVNDQDTGLYLFGSGQIGWALGGVLRHAYRVGGTSMQDDIFLAYGTDDDYWGIYNSAGSQWELWSTDVDGAASDGLIISIDDGTDDVDFTGGIVVADTSAFNGTLFINGAHQLATYTRHFDIEISAATTGPTAPTPISIGSVARGLEFDADAEAVFFNEEVPTDWVGNSDWSLEIVWTNDPGSAIGDTETVKWDCTVRTVAEGEDIDSVAGTLATATYTQSGAGTDGEKFITTLVIDYDDANNPLADGDSIFLMCDRDVTGDTYASGAVVLRYELTYTSNMVPTH